MTDELSRQSMPPPAPPGLRYRPFQVEAIVKSRKLKNILIADEMGLGKSIEAIGIINDDVSIRKVLIVCPASLVPNWRSECLRWLVRRNITLGLANTKRGFPASDIVIISYDSMKPFHRNIHNVDWDLIICDEAHMMKNPNSNRAMEILGREHKNPMRFRPRLNAKRAVFLTGTPIVNRPSELFSLLHYLDPEEFDDKLDFLGKYCGGSVFGQNKHIIGEANLRDLHDKLVSTVMIRRKKEDVLKDLPPKIRQVIIFPTEGLRSAINREQAAFREVQKNLSLARLKAELAKAVDNDQVYAAAVRELHQIEIVSINQIAKIRQQTALAKLPLVVEHVKSLLYHVEKVVMFAHHTSVIENAAVEFGRAAVTAYGKIPPKERHERINRFQTDPGCRVFIGGIRSAGLGHTLTASQVVIFCEEDWTPAAVSQAEDRCHRIGQTGSVLVQHLILDGSIDAMVVNKIVEKQETISAAMDEDYEIRDSLYSLSKATPFVKDDREEILKLARELNDNHIGQIHRALVNVGSRRIKKGMSNLDYSIIRMLAALDELHPNQAALGLALLRKHQR